jgi:type I site-specific restriction-modification system R (restriction) subunit
LLRQIPVQAESREHLRELLNVASGGVVFTTIQKFFPGEKGGKHPLLSAGQPGKGYPNGFGTGEIALRRLGRRNVN